MKIIRRILEFVNFLFSSLVHNLCNFYHFFQISATVCNICLQYGNKLEVESTIMCKKIPEELIVHVARNIK